MPWKLILRPTSATALLLLSCLGATGARADEQLRVRDICRLKGQEENTLQGYGLVVGLKGTGDDKSIKPTARTLARMMQVMGGNIATDTQGLPLLEEIEGTSNVALVMVTASIPPAGAQQGDTLNCSVSAIGAKSLQGGRLMLSYLLGPRADRPTVYALAQGPISLPDPALPTSGMIYDGCKMEATITNEFTSDGKLTLILDRDLASFSTAVDIQDTINGLNQSGLIGGGNNASDSLITARAIDQLHVEVPLPTFYQQQPVQFVSLILDLPLAHIKKKKRVVINQREGVITIGEDVMISPVVITHKNLSIEARSEQAGFVGIDTASPGQLRPKLKNLVEALNALSVPTVDVIAIIRTLKRNGDLYGELVIQ